MVNQHPWYVRAIAALVSPEALSQKSCLQTCAILGSFFGGAGVLAMVLGPMPRDFEAPGTVQAGIGISLLVGAGLSSARPHVSRPYLLLVGTALVAAVMWYPLFMAEALKARNQSTVTGFSHAPGVLAIGLAFGFRLLVDFGVRNADTRSGIARYAGLTGLGVGGCLDAFVLYVMVAT